MLTYVQLFIPLIVIICLILLHKYTSKSQLQTQISELDQTIKEQKIIIVAAIDMLQAQNIILNKLKSSVKNHNRDRNIKIVAMETIITDQSRMLRTANYRCIGYEKIITNYSPEDEIPQSHENMKCLRDQINEQNLFVNRLYDSIGAQHIYITGLV